MILSEERMKSNVLIVIPRLQLRITGLDRDVRWNLPFEQR